MDLAKLSRKDGTKTKCLFSNPLHFSFDRRGGKELRKGQVPTTECSLLLLKVLLAFLKMSYGRKEKRMDDPQTQLSRYLEKDGLINSWKLGVCVSGNIFWGVFGYTEIRKWKINASCFHLFSFICQFSQWLGPYILAIVTSEFCLFKMPWWAHVFFPYLMYFNILHLLFLLIFKLATISH